MNDSRLPKPKRRWYQFTLRTLLLVTLVLGVLFAWVGTRVQRARKNRQTADEVYRVATVIEEAGGDVLVGYVEAPDWLGRLLGDPGVLCVDSVFTSNPAAFNDDALRELIRVIRSEEVSPDFLDLAGTQITDAGLMHLQCLPNLRVLALKGTRVSDAGLEHLKELTQLEELELIDTQVTDAGLVHLKELTHLRGLHLDGTKVTDAGLGHLKCLCELTSLRLPQTNVTKEGIRKLRKALPNCEIYY